MEKMGINTPNTTTEIANELIKHGFNVVDISYKNDCTDSLSIDGINVYVPNSFVKDSNEELFNDFVVKNDNLDTIFATTDLYKLIEWIIKEGNYEQ